ncbi:MAG: hypothetical protein QHC89_29300, partial [Bosea sp. (in: a-proteobacteria)]|nr:hypothetical protein [Bosea sp. (in: a-proteobacteria)]
VHEAAPAWVRPQLTRRREQPVHPISWGSGRFSGVARDAQFLAEQVELRMNALAEQNGRSAT